jgi:hypothetical protein
MVENDRQELWEGKVVHVESNGPQYQKGVGVI